MTTVLTIIALLLVGSAFRVGEAAIRGIEFRRVVAANRGPLPRIRPGPRSSFLNRSLTIGHLR
jgi:hypothetical protein